MEEKNKKELKEIVDNSKIKPKNYRKVVFTILSFTIFKNTYKTLAKKLGIKILVVMCVLVMSFCYGMVLKSMV